VGKVGTVKRALFASFVVALLALTVSGPASALDDGVQRERALESKSDLSVFDKAGPLSEGDSARIAELIDEDLGVELRAADSKGKTYVRGEADHCRHPHCPSGFGLRRWWGCDVDSDLCRFFRIHVNIDWVYNAHIRGRKLNDNHRGGCLAR